MKSILDAFKLFAQSRRPNQFFLFFLFLLSPSRANFNVYSINEVEP